MRVVAREVLVRGERDAPRRSRSREQRGSRSAVRSATSRCSCSSCSRRTASLVARELRLVVVALDRRREAAVEQRARARREQRCVRAGSACLAGAHEQHLLHVALGQRSLPARRPATTVARVARALRRPDRENSADRRDQRDRHEDRHDRPPRSRCKGLEGPGRPQSHLTTRVVCMPDMKCPDMLQKSS